MAKSDSTPTQNANDTTRIIYSMLGVSKTIDRKPILKDIGLSYYYGAKIGVLGLNGSGKSTLLKIMAGVDKDFEGKVTARRATRSATSSRSRCSTIPAP